MLRLGLGFRRDLRAAAALERSGVPVVHAGYAALALLAGLSLGCEEDCDWGAARCNGRELEVCEEVTSDGHSHGDAWNTTGCGRGVCIDLAGEEPFCAEDDEPDPRCDANVEERKCVGELLLLCTHGYAGRVEDCSSDAGYCVDLQGNSAQCAVEAEPNAFCGVGVGVEEACDGDALVVCDNGYVTARQDCSETGEYCVEHAIFTECLLSAQPDPRCPPSAYDTVCDGELLISCISGYVAASAPCPAGEFCKLSDCEFCDANYSKGNCADAE